ncbi:MAG: hypothetical protein JNK14_15635 [Chitinophagaceae bacterium]|nr:hypothetical protein [Chitinophagaceae bacterium]
MANVTYLLGAGASANCLPTYINFFDRFERFKNLFQDTNPHFKDLNEIQKRDAQNILEVSNRILEESQFHNTPDTIAKKYFHNNSDSSLLTDLKEALIIFFLHQQILKQKHDENSKETPESRQSIDKRYDAFIASLLEPKRGNLKLYNNFKILTWNYDLQFEIAYSRYRKQNIPYCQTLIQSYPTIVSDGVNKFDIDKFGIVHLNGIAYGRGNIATGSLDLVGDFFSDGSYVLKYLTDVYHSIRTVGIPGEIGGSKLLSFAWEKQNDDGSITDNDIIKKAIDIAKQTEILVIIGYSFPIFNTPIDKMLLKEMAQIKKVYIQSPSGQDIRNSLLYEIFNVSSLKNEDIKDLGYWNQFRIPSEWNMTY